MIITQRQENIQAAEKAKKSKDIIESQLKNIVEGGGIGVEACELNAKVYANLFSESDIIKDEKELSTSRRKVS